MVNRPRNQLMLLTNHRTVLSGRASAGSQGWSAFSSIQTDHAIKCFTHVQFLHTKWLIRTVITSTRSFLHVDTCQHLLLLTN